MIWASSVLELAISFDLLFYLEICLKHSFLRNLLIISSLNLILNCLFLCQHPPLPKQPFPFLAGIHREQLYLLSDFISFGLLQKESSLSVCFCCSWPWVIRFEHNIPWEIPFLLQEWLRWCTWALLHFITFSFFTDASTSLWNILQSICTDVSGSGAFTA